MTYDDGDLRFVNRSEADAAAIIASGPIAFCSTLAKTCGILQINRGHRK
ncbi:hypothetical protein [Mesorhizobium ciceri]